MIRVSLTSNPALSIPLKLKAAAYNGILTSNIEPLTNACPTGNCTWPITRSLAICGECSNSTYQQSCGETLNNLTVTLGGEIMNNYTSPVYRYTVPSGAVANLTDFGQQSEGIGFQVMASLGAVYNMSHTDRLYIANFDIVGAPANSYAAPSQSIVASECALWISVQAYETRMVNSNQTQLIVQSFSQVINSDISSLDIDDVTFLNLPAEMNPRLHTNYTVGTLAAIAFQEYLPTLFTRSFILNLESQSPSGDVVQAIYNTSANLDGWIQNVASSISHVVRTTNTPKPTEPDDLYNGTGYQLGVKVQWAWITLPVMLVTLSLITLLATIAKTARSPVGTWKGSPLALFSWM